MYVYIKTEPSLWTVGFYKPDGEFESESDHVSTAAAAKRVSYLNGSGEGYDIEWIYTTLRELVDSDAIKNMLKDEREYAEAMADAADAKSY